MARGVDTPNTQQVYIRLVSSSPIAIFCFYSMLFLIWIFKLESGLESKKPTSPSTDQLRILLSETLRLRSDCMFMALGRPCLHLKQLEFNYSQKENGASNWIHSLNAESEALRWQCVESEKVATTRRNWTLPSCPFLFSFASFSIFLLRLLLRNRPLLGENVHCRTGILRTKLRGIGFGRMWILGRKTMVMPWEGVVWSWGLS